MLTVMRVGLCRFFFNAGDWVEPEPIHTERADSVAKFWLAPVRLQRSRGFDRRELKTIQQIVEEHQPASMEAWHEYSRVEMDIPNAIRVDVSDDAFIVELSDARSISVPLAWYPRLLPGRPDERRNWRLIGGGKGIHWDNLDEDISVEGLLAGRRPGESQASLDRWLAARADR